MPELRPYPKGSSRTLIDYTAITELIGVGEGAIVCLPVSVIPIIRKLLLDRGLWRTTYVIDYGEMGYTIPTDVEFNPIRQIILETLQEIENMTCASDVKLGLLAVANAITALARAQCCNTVGVNIYQGTDEEGDIIYGTEPPIDFGDPEVDPPPDGYETWDDWFDQLCQNTYALADSFIATLSNLSYLSVFNLSVLVGAVGAFILLPPSISPMLLFWLAQLILSLSTLRELGAWLESNKNELVCAIYNADNAASAQTAIRGVLRTGLTDASIDPALHETILNIAMALLSTDTLNQLYTGEMKVTYPGADCEGCLQLPCEFEMVIGSVDQIEVESPGVILVRFQSAIDTYAPTRQAVWFEFTGDDAFGWQLASEAITGGVAPFEGYWYGCDNAQLYRTTLPNPGDGAGDGTYQRAWVWCGNTATPFYYTIRMYCKSCAV